MLAADWLGGLWRARISILNRSLVGLGLCLTIWEAAVLFFPKSLHNDPRIFVGIIVVCLGEAVVHYRPRTTISRRIPNTDALVRICIGDVFDSSGSVAL
jgi:hypothetical protein